MAIWDLAPLYFSFLHLKPTSTGRPLLLPFLQSAMLSLECFHFLYVSLLFLLNLNVLMKPFKVSQPSATLCDLVWSSWHLVVCYPISHHSSSFTKDNYLEARIIFYTAGFFRAQKQQVHQENKPKHWRLIYLSSQSSYELKHYSSVLFFVNPAKRSGPRDTLFPFTLLLFSFLPC